MVVRYQRVITTAVLAVLFLCFSGDSEHGQQVIVVLNGNSEGRVFDGLGATSAGASSRLLIDYCPSPSMRNSPKSS